MHKDGRKPDFPKILKSAQSALNASAQSILVPRDTYYLASYPEICAAAQTLCSAATPNTLYALYNLAYGWMPTAPQHVIPNAYLSGDIPIIAPALKAQTTNDALTFLDSLTINSKPIPPINNSWIGTSKTLHFINPTIFPIWDSKIARHYGIKNRATYNRLSRYKIYLQDAHNWADTPELNAFQTTLEDRCEYKVTKIRALEYALFTTEPPCP